MSFVSSIRRVFGSTKETVAPAAPGAIDLRAHARLRPAIDSVVWIKSNLLKNPRLIDLSYGGAAIQHGITEHSKNDVEMEIVAVDRTFKLKAKIVHRRNDQTGFSFVHDGPEGLIFLRDVIENMKCGSTLQKLSDEMTKQEYRAIGAEFWRGDGPTDLHYFPHSSSGKSTSPSMQMTFRDGKDYYQVAIGDGPIITSKSRDNFGPEVHRQSNIMDTTRQVDLDVLRKTAFVLCGITNQELAAKMSKVVGEILAQFSANVRLVK